MTVLADLLSGTTRLDVTGDKISPDHHFYNELSERPDFAYPSGMSEADEVHEIAVYDGTVSGGTFTLEFTLQNGETFTTGAIAFDATAATIESAIDTAATGVVTGWTNGDISVAGGDLTSAPVTLTFDGDSVSSQNHELTVIDGTNLTGGGSAGEVTETTTGAGVRTALGALIGMGVLDVTTVAAPDYRATPTSWTVRTSAEVENYPSPGLIKFLAGEYFAQEQNETGYNMLKNALSVDVPR